MNEVTKIAPVLPISGSNSFKKIPRNHSSSMMEFEKTKRRIKGTAFPMGLKNPLVWLPNKKKSTVKPANEITPKISVRLRLPGQIKIESGFAPDNSVNTTIKGTTCKNWENLSIARFSSGGIELLCRLSNPVLKKSRAAEATKKEKASRQYLE